jgi:GNAT superfamily N-acetyltransferase
VPSSHEHNSLLLTGPVDAATVRAEAVALLGGWARPRAQFDRPPPAGLGWAVEEERLLVLGADVATPASGPARVVAVTSEAMAPLWRAGWHRDLPGVDDAVVDDLLRRESFADAHCRVVDLAVLGPDGVPVAGTQLRIDGATAAIEAVLTEPSARRQGAARSLVAEAIRRARDAGCDLVCLHAVADDWPRRWYERLGFADVGGRWVAVAPEPAP